MRGFSKSHTFEEKRGEQGPSTMTCQLSGQLQSTLPIGGGPPPAEVFVLASPPCSVVAGVSREEGDLGLKLRAEAARSPHTWQLGGCPFLEEI